MVPQYRGYVYVLVCILKVKIIPGAETFDSVSAITSNLRVLMLPRREKGGFCVTSEQTAAVQWLGK